MPSPALRAGQRRSETDFGAQRDAGRFVAFRQTVRIFGIKLFAISIPLSLVATP